MHLTFRKHKCRKKKNNSDNKGFKRLNTRLYEKKHMCTLHYQIMLNCFSMASGLGINLKKSHLLGVGVSNDMISHAAGFLGCGVLKLPFKYLGVTVGGSMSKVNA